MIRTALNRRRVLALLAVLSLVLSLAFPAVGRGEEAVEPVQLTILHTNDMHGRLLSQEIGRDKTPAGGIARIAGLAARVRAEVQARGGSVILLDAGDMYAGTPEGNLSKGRMVFELMAAARYDLAALGNHEFDDGLDNLTSLATGAAFPLLAANVTEKASGKAPPWLKPYVIREVKGAKVAFLGVVSADTGTLSGGTGGLAFGEEAQALTAAAAAAREEGAVLCIGVTHLGFDRDVEISDKIRGIPLLVGGHSHTYLKKGWKNDATGVHVVQAGCYTTHAGRVDLVFDAKTGAVQSVEATLVFLSDANAPPDPEVKALLETKSDETRRLMDAPLGENTVELERGGRRFSGASSPLGNLLADVMREGAGAQLAFHNRTGIREVLPAGPVTLRDVFKICPFGNTVCAVDLTGDEILELLEYALKEGNRYLLEVSGGEVAYDPKREPGSRVLSVTVAGEPLDREKTYRVATSNFVAAGGDGHEVFTRGRNFEDTGKLTRDLFAARLRASSPLTVEYHNRLVVPKGE